MSFLFFFSFFFFFFFNDTATTEIYTLSLHDALPISALERAQPGQRVGRAARRRGGGSSAAGGGLPARQDGESRSRDRGAGAGPHHRGESLGPELAELSGGAVRSGRGRLVRRALCPGLRAARRPRRSSP